MDIYKYLGILLYIAFVIVFGYSLHDIDIAVNGFSLGASSDYNGFMDVSLQDLYLRAFTGIKVSLILSLISFMLLLRGDKKNWSRI